MKNKAANILIIVYAVIGVFSVIAGILIFCWGVFGGILGLTEEPYGGMEFIGYLFILYVVVNVIMGVWALAAIAVAVIEMGKNTCRKKMRNMLMYLWTLRMMRIIHTMRRIRSITYFRLTS